MLHIIKTHTGLLDSLPLSQADDDILLIEDAVYALFRQDGLFESLKDRQDLVYVLEEDACARGLNLEAMKLFQKVDFIGFVSLTEQHLQSMTWD